MYVACGTTIVDLGVRPNDEPLEDAVEPVAFYSLGLLGGEPFGVSTRVIDKFGRRGMRGSADGRGADYRSRVDGWPCRMTFPGRIPG